MLVHIGRSTAAAQVYNAWLRTLEDGIHTADIFNPENAAAPSKVKVLGLRLPPRGGHR